MGRWWAWSHASLPLGATRPRRIDRGRRGTCHVAQESTGRGTVTESHVGDLIAERYRLRERVPYDVEDAERWRGEDEILGRDVLVTLVTGPRATVALDEARRASLVMDPRLVRVLDVGQVESSPYIVVERPAGRTLEEIVHADGPFSGAEARALVGEVAEALAVAERRGVHHVALRPGAVHVVPGKVQVEGLGFDGALSDGTLSGSRASLPADAAGLGRLLQFALTGQRIGDVPVPLGALDSPSDDDVEAVALASIAASLLTTLTPSLRAPSAIADELAPWGEVTLPAPRAVPAPPAPAVPVADAAEIVGGDVPLPDVPLPDDEPADDPSASGSPVDGAVLPEVSADAAPSDELAANTSVATAPDASDSSDADDSTADDATPEAQRAAVPPSFAPAPPVPAPDAAPVDESPADDVQVPEDAADVPAPPSSPARTSVRGMFDASAVAPTIPGTPQPPPSAAPVRRTSVLGASTSAAAGAAALAGGAAVAGAGAAADATGAGVAGAARGTIAGAVAGTVAGAGAAAPGAAAGATAGAGAAGVTGSAPSWDSLVPASGRSTPRPGQAPRPGGQPRMSGPQAFRFNPTAMVLVVALVAVLGGVLWSADKLTGFRSPFQWGSNARPVETGANGEPSSPATSTTPPVLPAIDSAQQLDPDGDENEHPEAVSRAIDLDPTTFWYTRTYRSATFAGMNKRGVGIAVTLEKRAPVSTVYIQSNSTGGRMEVRATDPTKPDGGTLLFEGPVAKDMEIALPKPVEAEHIVLWFTELPQTSGANRAEIREISVS